MTTSMWVRCTHCSSIYHVGPVKTVSRYADCTVYIAPCCGRKVDDRPAGWVSRPDTTPIEIEEDSVVLKQVVWIGDGEYEEFPIYDAFNHHRFAPGHHPSQIQETMRLAREGKLFDE